jgi:hypothetical protein
MDSSRLTQKELKITNKTDEETLDNREDGGRTVFEINKLIKACLEVDDDNDDDDEYIWFSTYERPTYRHP